MALLGKFFNISLWLDVAEWLSVCQPMPKSQQSSARIYRSSFERENDRFRENKPKPLVFNLIRTQKRQSRLVLDEIKLGGGFQILGLRRGRDQLVFMPKERPY
jgi:hypothetical protein